MSISVELSNQLISGAQQHACVYHRSIPKQIEYWSTIVKMAEENPDMPYNFIKDILTAQQEVAEGELVSYQFG